VVDLTHGRYHNRYDARCERGVLNAQSSAGGGREGEERKEHLKNVGGSERQKQNPTDVLVR